jgi:O-antigen/teichoic acid export membrane protein
MSRNAVALLCSRVVSALATVGVLAIVARLGDPNLLGLVALGLAIGLALAVIPEAGLTALMIREIAREPAQSDELLSAIVLTRAVALPLTIVAAGLYLVAARPADAGLILLVAVGPAIQQIGEVARSVFIARQRMSVASFHSIVENTAWFASFAAGLAVGMGLTASVVLATIALVAVDGIGFVLLRVLLNVGLAVPSRALLQTLFLQARPFVAFATLVVVASRVDTLLLGAMLPNGLPIAGAYFAAARLVGAGEYIPEAVGRAIYPDLARRFRSAPNTVGNIVAPAARQLLALGVFIALGVVLAGPWLFATLYGPDLAGDGWLLIVLAGALPLRFMTILFGVALTSADAQIWRTVALAVAVALSVAIQIALIPRIGVAGAVIGVYVVWSLTAGLSIIAASRIMGPVLALSDLLAPLTAGLTAFAIGVLVLDSKIAWAAPLSAGAYASVVVIAFLAWTLWTKRRLTRAAD